MQNSFVTFKNNPLLAHLNFYLIDHSLEIINLERNNISDADLEELVPHLKKYKNLKILDLSSNNISSNGIKSLSLQLKETKLKTLTLGGNKIGNSGLVALIQNLRGTSVKVININHNKITGAGIKKAAPYIQYTDLKILNFADNSIDEDGLREFAKHLNNTQLKKFSFLNPEKYSNYDKQNRYRWEWPRTSGCEWLCCYSICFLGDKLRICRERSLHESEEKEIAKTVYTVVGIVMSNLIEAFNTEASIQSRYYAIVMGKSVAAALTSARGRYNHPSYFDGNSVTNLLKAVADPKVVKLEEKINKEIMKAATMKLVDASKNKCCKDVAEMIIYDFIGDSEENREDIFLPMIFSQSAGKSKVNDAACGPSYLSFC